MRMIITSSVIQAFIIMIVARGRALSRKTGMRRATRISENRARRRGNDDAISMRKELKRDCQELSFFMNRVTITWMRMRREMKLTIVAGRWFSLRRRLPYCFPSFISGFYLESSSSASSSSPHSSSLRRIVQVNVFSFTGIDTL